MSRAIVLALVAACLSTVVGCGASQGRHSATPAAAVAADTARDDASWTSPEERELAVVETGAAHESLRSDAATSFRPNRNERPTRGAVHAATY